MKRLSVLCLLVAGIMYSTAAYARICFLGDLECQDGTFAVEDNSLCREQNSEWIHEDRLCKGLDYGSPVCNDVTGNYYNQGRCPSGYTDVSEFGEKYDCESSLVCNKCCLNEDVKCKDRYQPCEHNSQGDTSDICTETDDLGNTNILYGRCVCNKSVYGQDCIGTGIEGDYSDVCIDSNGKTWFKNCQCTGGYSKVTFADIKCSDECKDNCRIGSYGKLPGTDSYCWEGAECLEDNTPIKKCIEPQQSDFDTFWGGYDVIGTCKNLTVDCIALGYNTGEAGSGAKCVGGTEPYRCPFDHTKVYCKEGIAGVCSFYTKGECELAYFGSVCTSDSSKCYKPTGCKFGYAKTIDECTKGYEGIYSLGQEDEFGCKACICENTCKDKITKIPDNAMVATETCTSCGKSVTIIVGFECNKGYEDNGNGECVKIPCSEGNVTDVKDCGQTGAGGWRLGNQVDRGGCRSCIKKECPDGSGIDKYKDCTAAQNIFEIGYSGDDKCYQCLSCNVGFATDVRFCGASNYKGWYLGIIKDEFGCKQCIARKCPEGTLTQCPSVDISQETEYYAGDARCYECKTCSDGYAVDASHCAPNGLQGWHLSKVDKDAAGCYKCLVTQCPEGSVVGRKCLEGQEEVVDGYSAGQACIRCEGDPDDQPIATCESAGCKAGQYLCDGKCSIVANSDKCTYCTEDPNGGGTTPPGGGGSGSGDPCTGPSDTSCECILYNNPLFCQNNPDNFCCDTDEEEGSTDTGVTTKP